MKTGWWGDIEELTVAIRLKIEKEQTQMGD